MRIIMKVRLEIGWGIERERSDKTVIQGLLNFYVHLHIVKIKKWEREETKYMQNKHELTLKVKENTDMIRKHKLIRHRNT